MSISFPLSLPVTAVPASINFDAISQVSASRSPFTGSQQIYANQGEWLEADVQLPPMIRADAEEWVAFLLSLNGVEGTFLLGDPANLKPRGSWVGSSPVVAGGNQSGKTLVLGGLAAGLTALKGDWFQLGSSSTSRLHKVVTDSSVVGSPLDLRLDIWPRIREVPANNAAVVLSSPKGLFRLRENKRSWSIGEAQVYGIAFSCMEAI